LDVANSSGGSADSESFFLSGKSSGGVGGSWAISQDETNAYGGDDAGAEIGFVHRVNLLFLLLVGSESGAEFVGVNPGVVVEIHKRRRCYLLAEGPVDAFDKLCASASCRVGKVNNDAQQKDGVEMVVGCCD
jgi:hypothetical protein